MTKPIDQKTDRLQRKMTQQVEDANGNLDTFIERLNADPAHAFDFGGEQAMSASQARLLAQRVLAMLDAGHTFEVILTALRQEVLMHARQQANHSTSAIRNELNAMRLYEMAALVEWMERQA